MNNLISLNIVPSWMFWVKKALLMMIASMTEHWKVPVAYFLIEGLQGKDIANLVKILFANIA
jgi:hypothetical protein